MREKLFTLLVMLMLTISITGCGISIPLDSIQKEQKSNFKFNDIRPAKEKKFKNANKSDPTVRYGDNQFSPNRMSVLKGALAFKLGNKLDGHKVDVQNFDFVAFIPNRLNSSSTAGALLGPIGAVIVGSKPNTDLFICSLKASFDGQTIEVVDQEIIAGLYIDTPASKEAARALVERVINTFIGKVDALLK